MTTAPTTTSSPVHEVAARATDALRDARDYVALAEGRNGPIPRPVDWAWPWGDALAGIAALFFLALRAANLGSFVVSDGQGGEVTYVVYERTYEDA